MTCPPDCSLHLGLVACAGWSHGAWGMELLLGSFRRTSMAAPCQAFVGGSTCRQQLVDQSTLPQASVSIQKKKENK